MADIKIEGLTKHFEGSNGKIVAVDDLNLDIEHGEFCTFVGPSGCGKTTSLRMVAGLENPTSGEIYFDGEPVSDLTPQQRDIAMVFQNVALYPHMSNRDNIGYGLKVRGMTENYDEKIEEAAEMLEISELLDQKPGQLSGGQQQRVALGRAIVRDPNAILLDEPMSDLDAKLKAELRVEVQRLHQELDTTIIYVTHDQEEAMTMSDRISLMNNGELEQADSPENVFNEPTNEFVSTFMGQPPMNVLDATVGADGEVQFKGNSTDAVIDLGEYRDVLTERNIDSQVRFGFRPRHVTLNEDLSNSILKTTVDVWEPVGTDYIIYLTTESGETLKVVSNDISDLEHEMEIGIEDLQSLFFYTPDKEGETVLKLNHDEIRVRS